MIECLLYDIMFNTERLFKKSEIVDRYSQSFAWELGAKRSGVMYKKVIRLSQQYVG